MCYNPNHLFIIGVDKFSGKKIVKVYPKDVGVIYCIRGYSLDPSDWRRADSYVKDSIFDMHHAQLSDYVEIPCGKCSACLQRKSRDWATRMQLELPYYKTSSDPKQNEVWFVTLTYNDKNIPVREYTVTDDGFIDSYQDKTPIQKFIKRVRKLAMSQHSSDPSFKFKYYCTAELGSKTKRLHYHLILFGIRLDDVTNVYIDPEYGLRPQGRNNNIYYYSDILESKWSEYLGNDSHNNPVYDKPYGFVTLGLVSPHNMKYTAKYSSKSDCLWHCQSCKPSLGRRFFDEHFDKLLEDKKIIYHSDSLTLQCPLPRYFINLINAIKVREPVSIACFTEVIPKSEFLDALCIQSEWDSHSLTISRRMKLINDDLLKKCSLSRNDFLDSQEFLLREKIDRYRNEKEFF